MAQPDVLEARHLVATAAGNISAAAASIARALAWGETRAVSTVNDLESTLKALASAQRQLHEAITELRLATRD